MSWIAPVVSLPLLDKESAKFVFESAEKRLKHILDVSDRTTNRSISILTGIIPLLAFLLTGLFKHFFGKPEDAFSNQSLVICWISVIVCLLVIVLLGVVAFPRNMHQMGREPKFLYIKDFVDNDSYKNELQYKLYLVAETEDLQQRIDYMQAQSDFRVKLLKTTFLVIVFYFLACFMGLLLSATM
jgi:hypothetical protein